MTALRTAAVLVPTYRDAEGEMRVVLVVRADDGGLHGGQLGLPGGKPEPGDADLRATALREAQEEVGLDPSSVDVVVMVDVVRLADEMVGVTSVDVVSLSTGGADVEAGRSSVTVEAPVGSVVSIAVDDVDSDEVSADDDVTTPDGSSMFSYTDR